LDNELPQRLRGGRDQRRAVCRWLRAIGGVEFGEGFQGRFERSALPAERGRGLLGDLVVKHAGRALPPQVGG
jgi:hypothetical protein